MALQRSVLRRPNRQSELFICQVGLYWNRGFFREYYANRATYYLTMLALTLDNLSLIYDALYQAAIDFEKTAAHHH